MITPVNQIIRPGYPDTADIVTAQRAIQTHVSSVDFFRKQNAILVTRLGYQNYPLIALKIVRLGDSYPRAVI